jgi:hypothetical protein
LTEDGVESHPEILHIEMTDVASIFRALPVKFRQNGVPSP